MRIQFLLDENLSPRLKQAIQRYNPDIDVVRVGDEGAPSLGTSDSDLLSYLEIAQRVLVTDNRKTIPVHLAAHLAAQRHHWGVLTLRPRITTRQMVEDLVLIWEASSTEEWLDRDQWLPI